MCGPSNDEGSETLELSKKLQPDPVRIASLRLRILPGCGRMTDKQEVSHVHCQFQPSPDPKFVKRAAQMILDCLFAGADDLANFAIGQTFPDQNRNLNFR